MPAAIVCSSCKRRLLVPDGLWRERFAGRVQRLSCKRCKNTITIDGREGVEGQRKSLVARARESLRARVSGSIAPRSVRPSVRGSGRPPRRSRPGFVPVPLARGGAAIDVESAAERSTWEPASTEGPPDGSMPISETAPQTSVESVVMRWNEIQARGIASRPTGISGTRPAATATPTPASRVRDLEDGPVDIASSGKEALPEVAPEPGAAREPRPRYAPIALALLGIAAALTSWALLRAPGEPGGDRGSPPAVPVASLDPRPDRAEPSAARDEPPGVGVEEAALAVVEEPSKPDQSGASRVVGGRSPGGVAPAGTDVSTISTHDREVLKQVLRWVVRNAEQCHKEGRVPGSAELFITYSNSGTVSDARLVGEPIASAPVSRCVLDYARAGKLPPFEGPELTVSRIITLR